MHLDDTRISPSLATVELKLARAATWLIFTEQAAFLDGYNDLVGREEGTPAGLDNLDAELKGEPGRLVGSRPGMSISSRLVRPSRGATARWVAERTRNDLFMLRKE
jgi:hypothetical protein